MDAVDVVGIATDHCVRATALDAVAAGFTTRVLLDLTAGVARETTDRALEQPARGRRRAWSASRWSAEFEVRRNRATCRHLPGRRVERDRT
ncbi:hypothetical protein GCM10025868_11410 [Angustibacter aerolatus]|uniref:Isochorismatase-like domain-containing protein n=1 Tax=Angustibacter aerolatus TaxID=1162965 RepID=A0ABQ6JE76_9ACTN|nr:hypothetical protein GCM10025868_11410 [Angustibacter aerolatus]